MQRHNVKISQNETSYKQTNIRLTVNAGMASKYLKFCKISQCSLIRIFLHCTKKKLYRFCVNIKIN